MTHILDQLARQQKEFLADSLKAAANVTRSMRSIVIEAGECSRQVLDKSASAFEKLAGAPDLETALSAGSDCARAVIETGVAHSAKVADLYAEAARESVRPFDRFCQTGRGTS